MLAATVCHNQRGSMHTAPLSSRFIACLLCVFIALSSNAQLLAAEHSASEKQQRFLDYVTSQLNRRLKGISIIELHYDQERRLAGRFQLQVTLPPLGAVTKPVKANVQFDFARSESSETLLSSPQLTYIADHGQVEAKAYQRLIEEISSPKSLSSVFRTKESQTASGFINKFYRATSGIGANDPDQLSNDDIARLGEHVAQKVGGLSGSLVALGNNIKEKFNEAVSRLMDWNGDGMQVEGLFLFMIFGGLVIWIVVEVLAYALAALVAAVPAIGVIIVVLYVANQVYEQSLRTRDGGKL